MAKFIERLTSLGFSCYEQYLASQHWKAFRKQVKRPKCFCCGVSSNLQVHHTSYENLGKELPTDVITVCDDCHTKIHNLVSRRVSSLERAHYCLLENGNKKRRVTTKQYKPSRNYNVWVPMEGLCNPAFKETVSEVENNLRDARMMDDDDLSPTQDAIMIEAAMWKDVGNGKHVVLWNRAWYVITQRRKRRNRRAMCQSSE